MQLSQGLASYDADEICYKTMKERQLTLLVRERHLKQQYHCIKTLNHKVLAALCRSSSHTFVGKRGDLGTLSCFDDFDKAVTYSASTPYSLDILNRAVANSAANKSNVQECNIMATLAKAHHEEYSTEP